MEHERKREHGKMGINEFKLITNQYTQLFSFFFFIHYSKLEISTRLFSVRNFIEPLIEMNNPLATRRINIKEKH